MDDATKLNLLKKEIREMKAEKEKMSKMSYFKRIGYAFRHPRKYEGEAGWDAGGSVVGGASGILLGDLIGRKVHKWKAKKLIGRMVRNKGEAEQLIKDLEYGMS